MRQKIVVDPAEVERLAGRGLTHDQIAEALGIGARTLDARKKESALVAEAIKRGRAQAIGTVANKLFEAAEAGQPWAICFYLKCVAKWRETDHRIITGPNDGPIEIADATEAVRRKLIPEAFED